MKFYGFVGRVVIVIGFSILIFACLSITPLVQAQPEVFPPGSKPYGLSYGDWSAKWWQWLGSIPREQNPGLDETGAFCTVNQNATEPVVLLAGTFSGNAERTCTIPSGKGILVSPVDVIFTLDDIPPTSNTEDGLRDAAKKDMDINIKFPIVKVNGEIVQNLVDYRVKSPLFNITVPADNVISVTPNASTKGVSDGIFVMLKPLPVGTHTIEFGGGAPDPSTGATMNFVNGVKYTMNVK